MAWTAVGNRFGLLLGGLRAQRRVVFHLERNGCRRLIDDAADVLLRAAEKRIEKPGLARVVSELAVLEEHVHRFPQRVVQDFDDLLVDERVVTHPIDRVRAALAGQREGHRPGGFRGLEHRRDVGVALGRTEPHHDVLGAQNRRHPRAKVHRQVQRGQRPLADDDGMDELDRDMLRVRDVRPLTEREEAAAAQEPIRHLLAGDRQRQRFAREERAHDLVAPHQRVSDAPRQAGRYRHRGGVSEGPPEGGRHVRRDSHQQIRGRGSPTSMSMTRVAP